MVKLRYDEIGPADTALEGVKIPVLDDGGAARNVLAGGAYRDGVVDTTDALNAYFLANAGSEFVIPAGTYRITGPIYPIRANGSKVRGYGDVRIVYDGPVGGDVVVVDKDLHNSGSSFTNCQITGLRIDGGSKARWPLDIYGMTSNCRIADIRTDLSVGLLSARDCWYSEWVNLVLRSQLDGMPAGMNQAAWEAIHNSATAGQFHVQACHASTWHGVRIQRAGTTSPPSGASITTNIAYVTGNVVQIDSLSLETTVDWDNRTQAAVALIKCDFGSGHAFRNVYLEGVHVANLFSIGSNYRGKHITVGTRLTQSSFSSRLWTHAGHAAVEINGILAEASGSAGNSFPATDARLFHGANACSVRISGAEIHEGPIVTKGGSSYTDGGVGQLGLISVSQDVGWDQIPRVTSGLTVSAGSDGTSDYVLVEPGAITDAFGEAISFGYTNTSRIGWLFRPPASAATWNVCVDTQGCVFLENQASQRLVLRRGKIVLATFTTNSSGVISGLTSVDNTFQGRYTRLATRREIWASAAPSSGAWERGDLCWFTTPSAGGFVGAVCTSSGSPGTWKSFGAIEA